MRRAWLGLGLASWLAAAAPSGAADDGALYARQGRVQIEAPELARWRMRVDALRTTREALETQVADLRVLLETAMTELERMTTDRDAWRAKAERRRNE